MALNQSWGMVVFFMAIILIGSPQKKAGKK